MVPSVHSRSCSTATPGLATGTTCFIHDALNRLVTVGLALATPLAGVAACKTEGDLATDAASIGVTVRFKYDARNRRVAKQQAGSWMQWALLPDGSPLVELWRPIPGQGSVPGTTDWLKIREYVWLEGRPLAQVEYPTPRAAGYTYSVHVDHLGLPRALTSATNAIVWTATPTRPYGDVAEAAITDPQNGQAVVTNLRLPGQYDERLLTSIGIQGPYYNWDRWYLPTLGRYMELDPIAVRGGFNGPWGPNWYGYAEGNPLRWTDPEGLEVSLCCRSIQTGSSLDAFADFMGLNHCYVRTDSKTAGMGSCTPGPLPSNPIGTPTCVTDHSSDSGSCTSIPMVNEACVNRKLAVGQSTGPWGPSNNCNTFAASVFWACLDAPLPPWIPSPNPTPWTIRR